MELLLLNGCKSKRKNLKRLVISKKMINLKNTF